MGGLSNGSMMREVVAGRPAIRMRGDVSLENRLALFRSPSTSCPTEMPNTLITGLAKNSMFSATARNTMFIYVLTTTRNLGNCIPRLSGDD